MINLASAVLVIILLSVLFSLGSDRLMALVKLMVLQGIMVSIINLFVLSHDKLIGTGLLLFTAMLLIKALEPYQPMFIEQPCQCQNVDVMAEIARGTHLPIATGERVFTKWGFREILEKGAASILQPDLCHAGGIHEVHIIAGMAEAYYAAVAPHNPLGPISLAACIQLDATIPNFIAQEHTTLGEGYLKQPFVLKDGFVDLPTGPGLGIELDEDALADKLDHDWRNRESYHPDDNVVVDW